MPQYQIYFDTLEGEKKYNVDISDNEVLEDVLRDILGELHEKGHMMRGLNTGDLKVIWGGREGRELDLSLPLPEQGVRPNDVLRVLVESYEGGGSLRQDRIEREWKLLGQLADVNPGKVEILERQPAPTQEVFRLRLRKSPGIESLREGVPVIRNEHALNFCYPRFYPEVPIECYCEEPLFHPNVKLESGFVCLWETPSQAATIVQAAARAQAMAAFRMVNLSSTHVMNLEAAQWYEQEAQPGDLVPLSWDELRVYRLMDGAIEWIEPGRRLARRRLS